jgi:predicted GH43/DUF377 family glycosyl hydrolase
MSGLKLQRLGMLMEPGNPQEIEGVLNPAAARGPDGELYLFPRLVARGNYSRIGIARVRFNEAGDPVGVERLGIALEPEADYELRPDGKGGCEDPRITFVEPLSRYIMTYTAFSSRGPRIALATVSSKKTEDGQILISVSDLGVGLPCGSPKLETSPVSDTGRYDCASAGCQIQIRDIVA